MSKIIRTPSRAEGGITADERAKMAEHVKLWTARAFRTEPIDVDKITVAIKGLYAAANLKEPRVVIVPSPRMMAFAGGFAAAIWWIRNNPGKLFAATRAATRAATDAATRAATDAATRAATATTDATYDATRAATYDATYAATYDATRAATYDATYDAMVRFYLLCARNWYPMYQGGNMWSAWDCYLSAARDILGLRLPTHNAYAHWEQAAIEGGFRMMHPEFCMVSDFPEILKTDLEGRPHCEDGPSHRWRDGWSLYHWHGVRVPANVVEAPATITIQQIKAEENQEVRRVMIERMGWSRFCEQAEMTVIHRDELRTNFSALPVSELVSPGQRLVTEYRAGTEMAELLEAQGLRDFEDRPLRFVRVTDPSTGREYAIRVAHDCKRVYEGIGKSFGMSEAEYKNSLYIRHGDVQLVPVSATLNRQQHS